MKKCSKCNAEMFDRCNNCGICGSNDLIQTTIQPKTEKKYVNPFNKEDMKEIIKTQTDQTDPTLTKWKKNNDSKSHKARYLAMKKAMNTGSDAVGLGISGALAGGIGAVNPSRNPFANSPFVTPFGNQKLNPIAKPIMKKLMRCIKCNALRETLREGYCAMCD